jgi:hypothetical protein
MGTLTPVASLPPTSPIPPCSLPASGRYSAGGPGPLVTQRPWLRNVTAPSSASLTRDRSPCLSRLNFRPFHPQPPQYHFAMLGLACYVIVMACHVYPPGRPIGSGDLPVARSRVRRLLAGSPTGSAESGSLSLRTGRSPQVAPHLFSRKRSYLCWIQAGNIRLEGTSTLLFKRLHRRTSLHRSA